MSLLNFVPNAVSQGQHDSVYAEVTTPLPTSFASPLYVVMPDWTREVPVEILDWPQVHGSVLPTAGAACLLQTDSRGYRRCVWWSAKTNALTWTALPLNPSNWINQGGTGHAGEAYQVAQYARDGLDWVSVRGLVSTSSPYAFGGASATVATLPAGARPGSIETFGVYQLDGGGNHMIVRLDVNADGTMILVENEVSATGTGNTGSASYLSLAGIRFYQVN